MEENEFYMPVGEKTDPICMYRYVYMFINSIPEEDYVYWLKCINNQAHLYGGVVVCCSPEQKKACWNWSRHLTLSSYGPNLFDVQLVMHSNMHGSNTSQYTIVFCRSLENYKAVLDKFKVTS